VNFSDSTFHLGGFDQFMTNPSHEIQVDISHVCACQTRSAADRLMSENDDDNSALLCSSYSLTPNVKLSIQTIEGTSRLTE
jgi:hypothetical protein